MQKSSGSDVQLGVPFLGWTPPSGVPVVSLENIEKRSTLKTRETHIKPNGCYANCVVHEKRTALLFKDTDKAMLATKRFLLLSHISRVLHVFISSTMFPFSHPLSIFQHVSMFHTYFPVRFVRILIISPSFCLVFLRGLWRFPLAP